jgi:hypothetical protein
MDGCKVAFETRGRGNAEMQQNRLGKSKQKQMSTEMDLSSWKNANPNLLTRIRFQKLKRCVEKSRGKGSKGQALHPLRSRVCQRIAPPGHCKRHEGTGSTLYSLAALSPALPVVVLGLRLIELRDRVIKGRTSRDS